MSRCQVSRSGNFDATPPAVLLACQAESPVSKAVVSGSRRRGRWPIFGWRCVTMLSPAENERLTRVGPGTPCGELMRRYWIPIALYAQLLEDPVRKVRVLGEDLGLYKNRQGGLGLIGDCYLHRRVDVQWGIPDENGLRCPYHGWLYDQMGQCIDTPLEAPESTFKQR